MCESVGAVSRAAMCEVGTHRKLHSAPDTGSLSADTVIDGQTCRGVTFTFCGHTGYVDSSVPIASEL